MNDNSPSISLRDQGQSIVFLSLKSKSLIAADGAKRKGLRPCQCPGGTRGILSVYLSLSPGDLWWPEGGRRPCLCPGFSREQISRAGDSRSHEKTVADVSLLSNTLWIPNLVFFSGGGWVSVCLHSCSLFFTYGVYTTLEWGVVNKSSKGASWEM